MESAPGDVSNPYTPISHYFETRGRAAEIARARGSGTILGEHFFLGMVHDGTWHAMRALARVADLDAVEAAVLAILDDPGYRLPPVPDRPAREGRRPMVMQMWGVRAAVRMGHRSITVDHAFLDLIGQPDTVPARALASLGLDLDALAETVTTDMNTPEPVPADAVYLPEGQELDEPLKRALVTTMPRGTGLSLSPGSAASEGRPWIKVHTGDATTVLNTALTSLGRPTLD
jgi:ATP-dependent Clp protease ATP-binding subunit ClpA